MTPSAASTRAEPPGSSARLGASASNSGLCSIRSLAPRSARSSAGLARTSSRICIVRSLSSADEIDAAKSSVFAASVTTRSTTRCSPIERPMISGNGPAEQLVDRPLGRRRDADRAGGARARRIDEADADREQRAAVVVVVPACAQAVTGSDACVLMSTCGGRVRVVAIASPTPRTDSSPPADDRPRALSAPA